MSSRSMRLVLMGGSCCLLYGTRPFDPAIPSRSSLGLLRNRGMPNLGRYLILMMIIQMCGESALHHRLLVVLAEIAKTLASNQMMRISLRCQLATKILISKTLMRSK